MIQTPSTGGWYGPDIAALCVSTAAALIAGAVVFVSYLLYRSQTDPDVIVYAQADEGRPSMINLIIENKGNANAHDVAFAWTGKLPAQAWGIPVGGTDKSKPMQEGPLVHGIPFLPPGGKRVITWGQYGGIYKGLAGKTLEIQIRFRSRRKLLRGYRTHETSCPLEIRSFEATDASDRNWDRRIAKNLEELKKSIDRAFQTWIRGADAGGGSETDVGSVNQGRDEGEDNDTGGETHE